MDDARRRRARIRACTIWGIWGWVQSRDWTSYLRGGFGPKSARSFGGDARSPVDCIKRRVPGRAGRGFFSVKKTEKEASATKNKESINAAADRRDSCTTTREGGERDGDARAPRAGSLSYHERRSAVGFERPLHVNGSLLRDLARFNEEKRRADHHHHTTRAAPLSRLETRRSRVAAHALVTFAASMSVTAFLAARTCVWTRSMAALDSLSSCAARADESPTRDRNRL